MSDPFADAEVFGRIHSYEAFRCEKATRIPVLHQEDVMVPAGKWVLRSIADERVFVVDEEEFEAWYFPIGQDDGAVAAADASTEDVDDEG